MGDSSGDREVRKRLEQHLAEHDGVITAAQAQACGLNRYGSRYRVSTGEWHRMAPGVYLSNAHPLTDAARVRIGVQAVRGIADGLTAAWWWGIHAQAPNTVTATVKPGRADHTGHVSVTVRRRKLCRGDSRVVKGLAVTSPALTTIDAAALSGGGAAVVDRALQIRAVTLPDLRETLEAYPCSRGIGKVRKVIRVADGDTESAAERSFLRLLRKWQVQGWVTQLQVGPYRIDCAFEERRVAVEIDGWAFHRGRDRFHADREKQNYLVARGWTVLRFTWHDIVDRPAHTIETLLHVLNAPGR